MNRRDFIRTAAFGSAFAANTWYVDPVNGNDAHSGRDATKPVKTLAAMMSTDPIPDEVVGVWNVFHMMKGKIDGNQS